MAEIGVKVVLKARDALLLARRRLFPAVVPLLILWMLALLPVTGAQHSLATESATALEALPAWSSHPVLQWLSPILAWHAARLLFSWSVSRACPWLRRACMCAPLSAKDQAEVATRGFYTIQHTCLSVIGGLICWRAGWLTGPGYEIFYTWPLPHALGGLDGPVRFFYQLQGGVHLESACVLLHSVWRDGGKRQRMMLTHHVMTLFLVFASWIAGTHLSTVEPTLPLRTVATLLPAVAKSCRQCSTAAVSHCY